TSSYGDWSSDVCSSDLASRASCSRKASLLSFISGMVGLMTGRIGRRWWMTTSREKVIGLLIGRENTFPGPFIETVNRKGATQGEIGRASCRESEEGTGG